MSDEIDLDDLERVANCARLEREYAYSWWPYEREFDYVKFGPELEIKDNGEGWTKAYRFIADCSPDVVLELIAVCKAAVRVYEDTNWLEESDSPTVNRLLGAIERLVGLR